MTPLDPKQKAVLRIAADLKDGGHRALVFSQFTSFLKKAAARLDELRIPYAYLDGSTTDRARVLERFTSGQVPVFLVSLKAGGFGLNLTQADYCFLLDPWWNPATEEQAVDRTHRIGQPVEFVVLRDRARKRTQTQGRKTRRPGWSRRVGGMEPTTVVDEEEAGNEGEGPGSAITYSVVRRVHPGREHGSARPAHDCGCEG